MAEQADPDVRQGAKAAATAAAVGAAVGVARALAARHGEAPGHDDAPHDDDPERDLPEEDGTRQRDEPEPEAVSEPGPEPELERAPEPDSGPREGAGVGEIRHVTGHARELLQELSGAEVEAVSGIDRLPGGWRVTLEVVELRRIPDSTDVLASYEVELDRGGDLVRYERLRRYARSQSDGGGRG